MIECGWCRIRKPFSPCLASDLYIDYCPLHAAAGQMRDALLAHGHFCVNDSNQFHLDECHDHHEGACRCGDVREALKAAEAKP